MALPFRCFFLLLLVLVLGRESSSSKPNSSERHLQGVYYRVIGNGNFATSFVDINTSDGVVSSQYAIGNAYASYFISAAFDPKKNVVYWPYPSPYGTTLYILPQTSRISWVDYSIFLNSIHWLPPQADNSSGPTLYAISDSDVFSLDPVTYNLSRVLRLSADIQPVWSTEDHTNRRLFILSGNNYNFFLDTISLSGNTTDTIQVQCEVPLGIFYDQKLGELYAVNWSPEDNSIAISSLNQETGVCETFLALNATSNQLNALDIDLWGDEVSLFFWDSDYAYSKFLVANLRTSETRTVQLSTGYSANTFAFVKYQLEKD